MYEYKYVYTMSSISLHRILFQIEDLCSVVEHAATPAQVVATPQATLTAVSSLRAHRRSWFKSKGVGASGS